MILRSHKGPTSSSRKSEHYAPKVFARSQAAKQAEVTQKALEAALDNLIADGRVIVGSEKTHGGTREKLMEADNSY